MLSTPAIPALLPRRRWRDSAVFKLGVVGALVLLLMIPLAMVQSLVAERAARKGEVEREIAAVWGQSQTIEGPVLSVPYVYRWKDDKGKVQTGTETAFFLPETLRVRATLLPEKRSRGIFETVVHRDAVHLEGTFARPDLLPWHVADEDVLWTEARLSFGIPDLRGMRGENRLQWGDGTVALEPGGGVAGLWNSGVSAPAPGLVARQAGETIRFALDLGVNGSGALSFVPLAKDNEVVVASKWPNPSFTGAFLPVARAVRPDGFEAQWRVSYFGRSYAQQWRASEQGQLAPGPDVEASSFGVSLFLPADGYQKTERSLKYGVLFLLLTFGTFFLFEVFHPVGLHPVQYLLVGFALCLFYLLLLSTAEQIAFARAYLVAATATVGLITAYSWAILRGRLRAFTLAGVLATLYGYLYVLLQAEDYALLLGSVGLFVVLALVMFVTRRVDWSGTRGAGATPVPEVP